ncbi:hypothetical protein QJS10_CPB18g00702 [Acorus calamus]|uniref:Uncharacterized protein n=1 Tax=Acorus calamus TaxID=4465 RepID=A0AAV9CKG8_ACOCL|nr:hypothetical protein QJS10_CPB18g00702 [Acorus calamus]
MDRKLVTFMEHDDLIELERSDGANKTMLTEYFIANHTDPEAKKLLYREFPEHYMLHTNKRCWKRRKIKRAIDDIILAGPLEDGSCQPYQEEFLNSLTLNGLPPH